MLLSGDELIQKFKIYIRENFSKEEAIKLFKERYLPLTNLEYENFLSSEYFSLIAMNFCNEAKLSPNIILTNQSVELKLIDFLKIQKVDKLFFNGKSVHDIIDEWSSPENFQKDILDIDDVSPFFDERETPPEI